jgi:hypothetical protein
MGTEVQLASNNNKSDKVLSFVNLKKFRLLLKELILLLKEFILNFFNCIDLTNIIFS